MKSLQQLLTDWRAAKADMEKLVSNMPRIMGNEAVRVIKQNFMLHGYDSGNGFTKWDERKKATNKAYDRNRTKGKQGNYKGSVFSSGKPLLMQTLRLFNNIQYQVKGQRSVLIGIDKGLVPYGQRHNEGLKKMPKRQFMPTPNQPPNKKILDGIAKKYTFERDRAMRRFR